MSASSYGIHSENTFDSTVTVGELDMFQFDNGDNCECAEMIQINTFAK